MSSFLIQQWESEDITDDSGCPYGVILAKLDDASKDDLVQVYKDPMTPKAKLVLKGTWDGFRIDSPRGIDPHMHSQITATLALMDW